MKVTNLRLGKATNSSSSHSIVFHDGTLNDNTVEDFSYGWEEFILSSKAEKAKYFVTNLLQSLEGSGDEASCLKKAKEIMHWAPEESFPDKSMMYDVRVDHQSTLSIPRGKDGQLAYDLFSAVSRKIAEDTNLAVIGGNDNSDTFLPNLDRPQTIMSILQGSQRIRREMGGWVLFGNNLMAHVTEADDCIDLVDLSPTYRPELIDLKITDYCDKGCGFCYQGSSVNGKHASFKNIKDILSVLDEVEVLEIVLGGGEPTSHPKIGDILDAVPMDSNVAITTRNLSSPHITVARNRYSDYSGPRLPDTVGVSVSNVEEFTAASGILRAGTIQYILELNLIDNLWNIVEAMKARWWHGTLLILGAKYTGKAKDFPQRKLDFDWLGELKERIGDEHRRSITVSVDTAIVENYRDLLDKNGVNPILFAHREGITSKYIDAVEGTIAASSYRGQPVSFLKADGSVDKDRLAKLLITKARPDHSLE